MRKVLFEGNVTDDPLFRKFRLKDGVELTSAELWHICTELQCTNQHVVGAFVDSPGTIGLRVLNTDSWVTSWQHPVTQMESAARKKLGEQVQLELRANAA